MKNALFIVGAVLLLIFLNHRLGQWPCRYQIVTCAPKDDFCVMLDTATGTRYWGVNSAGTGADDWFVKNALPSSLW